MKLVYCDSEIPKSDSPTDGPDELIDRALPEEDEDEFDDDDDDDEDDDDDDEDEDDGDEAQG